MDDQHNGGGLPPDNTPHVVYPDDPESALHPDIDPPMPRALASGGGTRTPPPPPPPDDEDDEDSGMLRMSFMEHLEELRSRLIRILMGFGVAFVTALVFANPLWDYIRKPGQAHLMMERVKELNQVLNPAAPVSPDVPAPMRAAESKVIRTESQREPARAAPTSCPR